MNLIELHLLTQENQFGFKKKHSTDLCIFTVKSTIEYYNMYNSPVYSCFLDASTAYDRVNHWTLFKKIAKPLYKMGHSEVLFLYNIERRTSGWNLVSRFILYLHGRSLCTVIPEWNRMSY